MNFSDCEVIDRHYSRLQQCLEPAKLLRYLENVGVFDEDDVKTISGAEKWKTSRENQVAAFVDTIKRREHGFRHLLKALLKSKEQDYLARELLEDDVYDEEEITSILSELENDLDETQSLQLRLTEEKKRHRDTTKELEEMRRSSIVFSDSSSSDLFADYDSNPGDGNEVAGSSPKEEKEVDDEVSGGEDTAAMSGLVPCGFQNAGWVLARNEDLEWEHEVGGRRLGSVVRLHVPSHKRTKKLAAPENLNSSSLGRLNETGWHMRCGNDNSLKQRNEPSSSLHKRCEDGKQLGSLEDRVAFLEKQLQVEKRRREVSENEVSKLQLEKEDLYAELEDTRDQLRESQINLYYDEDDYEVELCFEQGDDDNDSTESSTMADQAETVALNTRYSPTGNALTAARYDSPGLNKFLSQTENLRRSRLTDSWRSVNAQFYELDEYDNEIKVELDPSNILDTLRRLKTYTNSLYDEVLKERDELQYLNRRVSKIEP